MKLRDYQQAAVDFSMVALRRSLEPIVISMATGSGKSHVIAALADELTAISEGKSVLVLAPSKELVEQDADKYSKLGRDHCFFSASVGEKSLDHEVVFGTPGTVKNGLERFKAHKWAAVVIDECHGITPSIRVIVSALRMENANLRVIGLSATPYRMGQGYIYRRDIDGKVLADEVAKEPYFSRCAYEVSGRHLIDHGYLTKPVIGTPGEAYDASGLKVDKMGRFDAKEVDKTFVGKQRLTSKIMDETISLAKDRNGVFIYAATVRHAEECLASLPPEQSAMITGKTSKKDREDIMRRLMAKELKYVVNVAVLTTGVDAPHVDHIAILRKTESVGLLQQIVGRGTRLCDGKDDFLVMDYAGNIEAHCPSGDLFDPTIKAHKAAGHVTIDVECPECGTTNVSTLKKEHMESPRDTQGYYLALDGKRHTTELGDPIPVHCSRRCSHEVAGVRCSHEFVWKTCPSCSRHNDPTARHCRHCDAELIDPNKKLCMEKRKRVEKTTEPLVKPIYLGEPVRTKNGFLLRHVVACTATTTIKDVIVVPQHGDPGWQFGAYRSAVKSIEGVPTTVTYGVANNGRTKIYGYNKAV